MGYTRDRLFFPDFAVRQSLFSFRHLLLYNNIGNVGRNGSYTPKQWTWANCFRWLDAWGFPEIGILGCAWELITCFGGGCGIWRYVSRLLFQWGGSSLVFLDRMLFLASFIAVANLPPFVSRFLFGTSETEYDYIFCFVRSYLWWHYRRQKWSES